MTTDEERREIASRLYGLSTFKPYPLDFEVFGEAVCILIGLGGRDHSDCEAYRRLADLIDRER